MKRKIICSIFIAILIAVIGFAISKASYAEPNNNGTSSIIISYNNSGNATISEEEKNQDYLTLGIVKYNDNYEQQGLIPPGFINLRYGDTINLAEYLNMLGQQLGDQYSNFLESGMNYAIVPQYNSNRVYDYSDDVKVDGNSVLKEYNPLLGMDAITFKLENNTQVDAKFYTQPMIVETPENSTFVVEHKSNKDISASITIQKEGSQDKVEFDLANGQSKNLLSEYPDFFLTGIRYSITTETENGLLNNYSITNNDNASETTENPCIFEIKSNQDLNIKVNTVSSDSIGFKISHESGDGDLKPEGWIGERIDYLQKVEIADNTIGGIITFNVKMGETYDVLSQHPEFFKIGHEYTVTSKFYNSVLDSSKILINGNETQGERKDHPNNYYTAEEFTFVLNGDTKIDAAFYSKIMGGRLNFGIQNIDEEDEDLSHAPEYHEFYVGLSSVTHATCYYKLVEDNDGNLVYSYAGDSKYLEDQNMELPSDWVKYIRINNNKHTTVIRPYGAGAHWEYNYAKEWQSGIINGYTTSIMGASPSGGTDTYNLQIAYLNKFDVKTFEKTDVDGNSANASFSIKFHDANYDVDRKYVYKHYDSKVINGKTYENVYEVVGATTLDDESSNTIIKTQNGKYTLFYPLFYGKQVRSDDCERSNGLNGGGTSNIVGDGVISVSEVSADTGYLVNADETIELNYAKGYAAKYVARDANKSSEDTDENGYDGDVDWTNYGLFDYIDYNNRDNNEISHTVVNKKLPSIKKVLENGATYDREFTFEIYEKESGKIVATVKAKANEEVFLEPLVTNEDGTTTGYLEDGKTYIIREEVVEGFENSKIEGKNGEVKEDETSKYYEFTFDASLDKIFEATFYNSEVKAEIEEAPQTGDIIIKVCTTLAISLIVLNGAITVVNRKRK